MQKLSGRVSDMSDDWKLPHPLVIGSVSFGAGVSASSVEEAASRWKEAAGEAFLTDIALAAEKAKVMKLRSIIIDGILNAESVISNMAEQEKRHSGVGFCTKDEARWIKEAKQALKGTE